MLCLRPYKPVDGETIAPWCAEERGFRLWSADRYPRFPITGADMNRLYIEQNGDCSQLDNFFPMTAFDEKGLVGHLVMRYKDAEKRRIRFGYIIVAPERRGTGCARKMLKLALHYAFELLGAQSVELGVFAENPAARRCYEAVGFRPTEKPPQVFSLMGEKWNCIEMEILRDREE